MEKNGAQVTSVILALNREERGLTEKTTVEELEDQGYHVFTLITISEILEYLRNLGDFEKVEKIEEYLKKYGNK